jgi:hypothetical protein
MTYSEPDGFDAVAAMEKHLVSTPAENCALVAG